MALEAASIILLSLAVASLLLIAGYVRSNNGKPKPPHPPSLPIIGHLHLLRKKQPMPRILSSLSDCYGPIMHLQLGFRPVLVIASSDLAKECFTANDKAFASRPRTAAAKYMGYDNKMFSGLPYDSYLRELRKLIAVQIFSPSGIDSFKHVRTEELSAFIRSLFESCQREAVPINTKSRLSDLTSNIIARIVASKRVSDSQEADEFKEMIKDTFYLLGAFVVSDYLPFLKWLDLQGFISAMKKLQRKRDAFMKKLVDEHREKQGMHAHDFIDILISAVDNHEIKSDNNDDVVKATALGIIIGGTDTSAVTIEWAAALLQPLRRSWTHISEGIG